MTVFVPNGLTECSNPFLLDVSVVESPRWLFSSCSRCSSVVQSWWWFISSCSRCSLLKTGRLERFLVVVWLFPCTNPFLFFEWPAFQCSGPYVVRSSFLRLGGDRTFQNVQITSCAAVVDQTNRLFSSSSVVFLKFLLDVLFIRRRSCCLEARQFILLLYSERNCFFTLNPKTN
jgi:hypothetical protein